VGAKGVAVFEKVLGNPSGDALFTSRVGVVDDIYAAGGLVPEFPGVLVLNLSKAASLCGGEQVAEEAFRPAGLFRRDGAEGEQEAEVWAELEQAEEVIGVVFDHATEFGQVRAGIL